jgi:hypothetical protein
LICRKDRTPPSRWIEWPKLIWNLNSSAFEFKI